MRDLFGLAVMLTLAGAVAGCHQTAQSTAAAGETGRIATGPVAAGSQITVAEIAMPSTGWVVVHAVRDDQPDLTGSIGHAYVQAGPSQNIGVALDEPLASGDEAVVMLHLDTGVARVFEFGNDAVEKHDPPVLADGAPVAERITVR